MSRYDLSRGQLAALLSDQPSYRVDQVFDGLYRRLAEPGESDRLPVSFAIASRRIPPWQPPSGAPPRASRTVAQQ